MSALRLRAIVKTVNRGVTATHSQALPRSWRHEVSSPWLTSAVSAAPPTPFYEPPRPRPARCRSPRASARLPRPVGDHPGGDPQPQEVAGRLRDLPLAGPVSARQSGQHPLVGGAEVAGGNPLGQAGAGRRPAIRAGEA